MSEDLRHAKAEIPENGPEMSRLLTDNSMLRGRVAELERALSNSKEAWIPVTEKLPPIGFVVLAYDRESYSDVVGNVITSGKQYVARVDPISYEEGKPLYWIIANEGTELLGVTHWMPLPGKP